MNITDLIFPYDYIILILSLIIILFTTWKGFIKSILGLMTWLGSILITLYSYNSFADFLTLQIIKIDFFQNYETLSNFLSIIIAIPLIFLISLFILRRFRKVLSSDLDKQVLGLILDKIFGIFYGVIFSYFIFSTLIFLLNRFSLADLNIWIINNSEILFYVNYFNENYLYSLIPNNDEITEF